MEYDIDLIRLVHEEYHQGYKINAYINRFGGLYVAVYDQFQKFNHDSDNIIDARKQIDNIIKQHNDIAEQQQYHATFK